MVLTALRRAFKSTKNKEESVSLEALSYLGWILKTGNYCAAESESLSTRWCFKRTTRKIVRNERFAIKIVESLEHHLEGNSRELDLLTSFRKSIPGGRGLGRVKATIDELIIECSRRVQILGRERIGTS